MGTGSDLDIKRIPEKEVKDALNRMKAINTDATCNIVSDLTPQCNGHL